jgi:integrase
MFGKCKPAAQTNRQHSFCVAQNAATPSENTAKHCAFKGKILEVALKLRQLGYSEAYLETMIRALVEISKNADLDNPNEVSLYIAKKNVKESFKANLCDFYKHFADYYRIQYIKPKYHRDHKLPYVPTKEELSIIISHASKRYALIYSIMRDTGLRPVEISNIRLEDINLENGTINILSAKHGKPRIVKIKSSTLAMLKEYIQKHNFDNRRLFPDSGIISNTFCRLRTSLAKKLKNPNLKKIRLYDFRHYFATNLYYETKDLLLTKEMLGHRNINNTMIYTHLIKLDNEDKYHSAAAKTIEEASKLIENGFEYIVTFNDIMLFRKRK